MTNKLTDIQLYANHMAEVRDRVNTVRAVLSGRITTGAESHNIELIFLQVRKILELIVFASLIANKAAYSAVHKKFADQWRVRDLLTAIEELNPEFYPLALHEPQEIGPGRKHFDAPMEGFLTKEDLIRLYDISSKVMHTRNPYSAKDSTIDLGYELPEWIARIQLLLAWHRVKLISGDLWVVQVPDQGAVQLWPAGVLLPSPDTSAG